MQDDQNDPVSTLMRKHREELRYEMPPGLSGRIDREINPRIITFRRSAFASFAMAACMVVSVLSFQLGRTATGTSENDALLQEVVSGHVRSLMATHLSDVISTDRHTVKPWFEGKLDFGPDVQDFADKGFPLVGGRLDYIGNRNVAGLVYKHGQHVINLYEWPASSMDRSNPRPFAVRGYHAFAWQKGGLAYWLVSDVNTADLQNLAELISAP
jgi:anti-sigma factor RsiW